MQNEKGEIVDLYIPRRCYATNKLLDARDHSSVQISVASVYFLFKFRLDSIHLSLKVE